MIFHLGSMAIPCIIPLFSNWMFSWLLFLFDSTAEKTKNLFFILYESATQFIMSIAGWILSFQLRHPRASFEPIHVLNHYNVFISHNFFPWISHLLTWWIIHSSCVILCGIFSAFTYHVHAMSLGNKRLLCLIAIHTTMSYRHSKQILLSFISSKLLN